MKNAVGSIKITFLLLISISSFGQSQRPNKHNYPSGKMNAVSVGANLPLGSFSSTHVIGISAEYAWSDHRFGRMDVKPVRPFGFTANAGIAYYFGKKETVSGYPYDYPGYSFLHICGGVVYNPWKKGNINWTVGPALGIYNAHKQFNINSKLEGSYYFNERMGISPAIILTKEHGADALWIASLKATITF